MVGSGLLDLVRWPSFSGEACRLRHAGRFQAPGSHHSTRMWGATALEGGAAVSVSVKGSPVIPGAVETLLTKGTAVGVGTVKTLEGGAAVSVSAKGSPVIPGAVDTLSTKGTAVGVGTVKTLSREPVERTSIRSDAMTTMPGPALFQEVLKQLRHMRVPVQNSFGLFPSDDAMIYHAVQPFRDRIFTPE